MLGAKSLTSCHSKHTIKHETVTLSRCVTHNTMHNIQIAAIIKDIYVSRFFCLKCPKNKSSAPKQTALVQIKTQNLYTTQPT